MKISAGHLRHRITIEQQVSVVNSFGEQETSWQEFGKAWAAILPLSAKELITAQQAQSEVTAKIIIRYLPGVTASMRINHNGTIYNIAGVILDNDSMREHMTIPVKQGLNDG